MPAADVDGPPGVLLLAPPTLLLLLLVRTDAMEVRFPLILSFSSPQAAPDPLGFDLAGRVQMPLLRRAPRSGCHCSLSPDDADLFYV